VGKQVGGRLHSIVSVGALSVGAERRILLNGPGEPSSESRFEVVVELDDIELDLARFPLLGVEKSISGIECYDIDSG